MTIDGKPFVQFDSDRLWVGNIEESIRELREEIAKEGPELYLCSNILGWYFPNAPYDALEARNEQTVKAMDAISAHGNMWLYGEKAARRIFRSLSRTCTTGDMATLLVSIRELT